MDPPLKLKTQFINIISQGSVYYRSHHSRANNSLLQVFCKKLVNVPQESTFEALYEPACFGWVQQDDVANPFGDDRSYNIIMVWIFDLDNDILQLHERDQSRRTSLHNLRHGPVSIADLEPYDPPPLTRYNEVIEAFAEPNLDLEYNATNRQMAFMRRILEDFSFQWRHVLRSRYNSSTFRRFARAILRIVSLDFQVTEVSSCRGATYGSLVKVMDLPRWDSSPNHIILPGRIPIVLCQHVTQSGSIIWNDYRQRRELYRNGSGMIGDGITYLVLSVREVFLYTLSFNHDHNPPAYTKPDPFLNGIDVPSERAIEYLLMAMPSSSRATPIHNLPVEIQDMVLKEVSVEPVEAARVGCELALGSTLNWETDNHLIERQESFASRSPCSPVESQIWFDGCFSGLAYR